MRVAAVVVTLALGVPARAEPARYGLRGEAGAEYDTNAGRLEQVRDAAPVPVVGASLARLVLAGDLLATPTEGQSIALSVGAGAKWFVEEAARAEDVVIAQGTAGWTARLGNRSSIGLGATYYEAFGRRTDEARDFRSVMPSIRFDRALFESGALLVGGGYRWFTFKPDGALDFSGPTGLVGYRHLMSTDVAEWELSTGASLELRRFAGVRCPDLDACPGPADSGRRHDEFWVVHGEATRTGAFLAGLGVAVHGNRSNSYGEPLVRGVLYGRAVFELPWQLTLSGRGELLATRYMDALPLSRNLATGTPLVSIEDESRSTFRLELARALGPQLDGGLRYTYYTNEITGGPVRFRRHTALMFVAVRLDP